MKDEQGDVINELSISSSVKDNPIMINLSKDKAKIEDLKKREVPPLNVPVKYDEIHAQWFKELDSARKHYLIMYKR